MNGADEGQSEEGHASIGSTSTWAKLKCRMSSGFNLALIYRESDLSVTVGSLKLES